MFNQLGEDRIAAPNQTNNNSITETYAVPEKIVLEPIAATSTNLHSNKKEEIKESEGYETDEHIVIGNEAFEKFLQGQEKYAASIKSALGMKEDMKIILAEGLALSPGEIVALAGDFFGLPESPIAFGENDSAKKSRFILAHATLFNPKYHEEIKNILAYVKDQTHHSESGELEFQQTKDSATLSNIKFGLMTKNSLVPGAFWHSRYFGLATNNFDRFGKEAREAFNTGYKLALDNAATATTVEDSNRKTFLLKEAITYTLFACHFLTDLYASGHLRTPRKQILNAVTDNKDLEAIPDLANISSVKLSVAGLFAKKMHDEDSEKGIFVQNTAKEKWVAYGDGAYYAEANKNNAKKVCKAVIQALNGVIAVYENKNKNRDEILKTINDLIPESDQETNALYKKPLFKIENNTLMVRDEKENYKPMHTAKTLFQFFKIKIKPKNADAKILEEKEAELLIEAMEKQKVTCSIL